MSTTWYIVEVNGSVHGLTHSCITAVQRSPLMGDHLVVVVGLMGSKDPVVHTE